MIWHALDVGAQTPHPLAVSRLDGRSGQGRKAVREESPGSMDIRCRITSGGCEAQGKCHREQTAVSVTLTESGKGETVR